MSRLVDGRLVRSWLVEVGVGHAERLQDLSTDVVDERCPDCLSDDLPEGEVAEVRVPARGAGFRAQPAMTAKLLVEEAGRVGAGRCCWVHPADRDRVGEPGGVREEVANRDRGPAPRPQLAECGEMVRCGAIEIEDSLLDELHDCSGGHDLGHREPRERRVAGGVAAGGEIRVPDRRGPRGFAGPHDCDRHPDDALRIGDAAQRRSEPVVSKPLG